ncbi:MAG: DUF1801 domain-containing protein [Planctomycetota bacterium]
MAKKKVQIKTKATTSSVSGYLNGLDDPKAKANGKKLLKIFKEVTACRPKLWGESIVGFGKYTYYRANGDEGEMLATGFSMRKTGPVLYVLPGTGNYKQLLSKLGKHKTGKSCLYLKNLDDIDLDVLTQLIQVGLDDLKESHEVLMK